MFALPLFIDPIWWAERFGWDSEGATDLTVYFGRCLGAIVLTVIAFAVVAVREPREHRWIFRFVAVEGTLLAIVHLRGAIEDSQPLIEHLETAGYAALAAAALLCRPGRGRSARGRELTTCSGR